MQHNAVCLKDLKDFLVNRSHITFKTISTETISNIAEMQPSPERNMPSVLQHKNSKQEFKTYKTMKNS